MVELLAPAGSPQAVVAAVQNGADAIYLGFGDFNARRNTKNFTQEEVAQAVTYCHARNTKVFITLNTLLNQRELPKVAPLIEQAAIMGVDAFIIADLGVAEVAKMVAPHISRHASTQMTVHSLHGTEQMAELGFSRVVLSRELSKEQLQYICKHSPIETEGFVHGAMCMSYSGQCFFSAVVGQRSGNRGLCAQPCRLEYQCDGKAKGHPLSLKDMSLVGELQELTDMGLSCLKIEGRMKRAEYVAVVTKVYADCLKEKRSPTKEEGERLAEVFSRQGFTQGYYTGEYGKKMFGVRGRETTSEELYREARKTYEQGEHRLTPLMAHCSILSGEPISLTLTTPNGEVVTVQGEIPQPAKTQATTEEMVRKQLAQTGGTPYGMTEITVEISDALFVPKSALNGLRREGMELIATSQPVEHPIGTYIDKTENIPHKLPPVITVQVTEWSQISEELLACNPSSLYLPIHFIESEPNRVEELVSRGISIRVVLPRILSDKQRSSAQSTLEKWRLAGVSSALAGTWDSLHWGKVNGFSMAGDYGLGVFNNQGIQGLSHLDFVTLSFELQLAQIRDMSKPLPTELMGYGRLPLMIFEHKVGESITDRKGVTFPVVRTPDHRSEVLNATPLYLAHKKEWKTVGLTSIRLTFTDESPKTCVEIIKAYQTPTEHQLEHFTTGLYYRGVE
ncbi:MAG: U32 family peptidase [Eubacteriales bacterium]